MQSDEPAYLAVGTEVSAKFKGAFCEAKIKRFSKAVKCKVLLKESPFGSIFVDYTQVKGTLELNQHVDIIQGKETFKGIIQNVKDNSSYLVVFNDGDERVLRRTQLCPKGAKHFDEAVNLDALPLYNPDTFSNPVLGEYASEGKGRPNKRKWHNRRLGGDQGEEDRESRSDDDETTSVIGDSEGESEVGRPNGSPFSLTKSVRGRPASARRTAITIARRSPSRRSIESQATNSRLRSANKPKSVLERAPNVAASDSDGETGDEGGNDDRKTRSRRGTYATRQKAGDSQQHRDTVKTSLARNRKKRQAAAAAAVALVHDADDSATDSDDDGDANDEEEGYSGEERALDRRRVRSRRSHRNHSSTDDDVTKHELAKESTARKRQRIKEADEETTPKKKAKDEENVKKTTNWEPGKVVAVYEDLVRKGKWIPAVVVSSKLLKASVKGSLNSGKADVVVRTFKDGKCMLVSSSSLLSLNVAATKSLDIAHKPVLDKATALADKGTLPLGWDRSQIYGSDTVVSKSRRESTVDSKKDGVDEKKKEKEKEGKRGRPAAVVETSSSESSEEDEDYGEERDHFTAQLYKFHDERGTPINKAPILGGKDIDMFRLYNVVQAYGGKKRVTENNKWKKVLVKLHLEGCPGATPLTVKNAYSRYLDHFNLFYRRLGLSNWPTSSTTSRSVRQNRLTNREAEQLRKKKLALLAEKKKEREKKERESESKEKESKSTREKEREKDEPKKLKEKPQKDERKEKLKEKLKKEERELKKEKRRSDSVSTTASKVSILAEKRSVELKKDERKKEERMKEKIKEKEKGKLKEKEKEGDRSREDGKEATKEKSKHKDAKREKAKEIVKVKDAEKEKDKGKDGEKPKGKEKEKTKMKEKEKEKEKEGDKGSSKDKEAEKEKPRERDKEKVRVKEKEKEKDKDKEKAEEKGKEKERVKENEKSKEKEEEKDSERPKEKAKAKEKERDVVTAKKMPVGEKAFEKEKPEVDGIKVARDTVVKVEPMKEVMETTSGSERSKQKSPSVMSGLSSCSVKADSSGISTGKDDEARVRHVRHKEKRKASAREQTDASQSGEQKDSEKGKEVEKKKEKVQPEENYSPATVFTRFYMGQKVRAYHHGQWYDARVITVNQPPVADLIRTLSEFEKKHAEELSSGEEVEMRAVGTDEESELRQSASSWLNDRLEAHLKEMRCFVHYLGWNARYDAWAEPSKIKILEKDQKASESSFLTFVPEKVGAATLDAAFAWRSSAVDSSVTADALTCGDVLGFGGFRPRRISISHYEQQFCSSVESGTVSQTHSPSPRIGPLPLLHTSEQRPLGLIPEKRARKITAQRISSPIVSNFPVSVSGGAHASLQTSVSVASHVPLSHSVTVPLSSTIPTTSVCASTVTVPPNTTVSGAVAGGNFATKEVPSPSMAMLRQSSTLLATPVSTVIENRAVTHGLPIVMLAPPSVPGDRPTVLHAVVTGVTQQLPTVVASSSGIPISVLSMAAPSIAENVPPNAPAIVLGTSEAFQRFGAELPTSSKLTASEHVKPAVVERRKRVPSECAPPPVAETSCSVSFVKKISSDDISLTPLPVPTNAEGLPEISSHAKKSFAISLRESVSLTTVAVKVEELVLERDKMELPFVPLLPPFVPAFMPPPMPPPVPPLVAPPVPPPVVPPVAPLVPPQMLPLAPPLAPPAMPSVVQSLVTPAVAPLLPPVETKVEELPKESECEQKSVDSSAAAEVVCPPSACDDEFNDTAESKIEVEKQPPKKSPLSTPSETPKEKLASSYSESGANDSEITGGETPAQDADDDSTHGVAMAARGGTYRHFQKSVARGAKRKRPHRHSTNVNGEKRGNRFGKRINGEEERDSEGDSASDVEGCPSPKDNLHALKVRMMQKMEAEDCMENVEEQLGLAPLDESLTGEAFIAHLQERLQELRDLYHAVRAEQAQLDRRWRKTNEKRKQREKELRRREEQSSHSLSEDHSR